MTAITPNRTALVLIDFQVDFGSPGGEMARRGMDMTAPLAAVVRAGELVDAARAAKVKNVFVGLVTRPGGEESLCLNGTPGAAFIGPQPQAGDMVVSKTGFSAFARTGLGEKLRDLGIDTLVLAGLTTECCVASSAWYGFEQDFRIVIATDACAAYEEELHRQTLRALEMSGAAMMSVASLVTAWNKIF